MTSIQTLRRSWISIGWLAAIALGALVAVLNIYAGLLLMALAVVGAAAFALPRARAPQQQSIVEDPATVGMRWPSSVQRTIYTADGEARAAFVVPTQAAEGYQSVLTPDGYMLVNHEGQVVYRLKR
jgi:hypothetical protein